MTVTTGGPNLLKLDEQSSTDDQPHMLITADCSDPRELDDGIMVHRLPGAEEIYQVGVCVVDTSSLYWEGGVLDAVMRKTEAKYYQLPGSEKGYEPMVPEEVIEDLDFKLRKPGDTRAAMIVRFVVGEQTPPSKTEVVFGRVEVAANYDYHDFAALAAPGGMYERFGRAATLIKQQLEFTSGGDYDRDGADGEAKKAVIDPIHQGFIRGSRLNEAFMVGAGYQVGRLLIPEEDRLGIYRIHDPADEARQMFLPANVATYSWEPGPHDGLNLYGYCRVTSPLRRLEDFIMSHLLRQRYEGKPVTRDDENMVALAVQRLNARIMHEYANKPVKHAKNQALYGRNSRLLGRVAQTGLASALAIPPQPEAAIA